jgi:hypothetical protein
MHRQAGLVGQQLQEVGGRPLQAYLERAVVDRLGAELLRLRLALVDLLGVQDGIKDVGVLGARSPGPEPAVGEHEVGRLDGIAVRPLGVGAEREAVELAVVAHLPLLGRAGDDLGLVVVDHQAVIEVAQNMRLVDGRRLVRVERLGVGIVAAVVDHLGRGEGRHRDGGGGGHEEPLEPGRHGLDPAGGARALGGSLAAEGASVARLLQHADRHGRAQGLRCAKPWLGRRAPSSPRPAGPRLWLAAVSRSLGERGARGRSRPGGSAQDAREGRRAAGERTDARAPRDALGSSPRAPA